MTMASDTYAHCCAPFRAFLLSLALTIPASAHVGVTVPFVEVPDPTAITIDGDDGDWAFFDSRLALDREGFFDRESDHVDAADFDFTVYTAWSPPPDNSWYCFARIRDDTLKIENEDPLKWWQDDTLSITVDSDHSGGSIYGFTREELVNGQRYYARGAAVEASTPTPRPGRLSRSAPRSFLGGVLVGDAQTPLRHRVDDAPTRRGQRCFARRIYL